MTNPITYLEEALFLHIIWQTEDSDGHYYEPIKAQVASNGLAYYWWELIGHYVILHLDTGDCVIPHTIEIATPELCQQIIAGLDTLANWYAPIEHVEKVVRRVAIEAVLRDVGIVLPNGLYGTGKA